MIAADVLVINKIDTADMEVIQTVHANLRELNPQAIVVEAASPIYVDDPEAIRGKRVLVVEDDPGDQKLVKKSLDRDKIANELHIANSGEEALEYLQRSKNGDKDAPMPDLILLDLNMPGMGGQEFLKHLKSDDQLDTIPVILTTSDSDRDVLETFKLHAAGYVKKPGSLSEFKDVMQNISEYWFVICKRVKHASEYTSRDNMCSISR